MDSVALVSGPGYYIDLFTPETWQEAAAHGFTITGFSERRRNYASRVAPGDIFLCYLTGKSRFIGALRATSEVFHDETPIWASQVFPVRFRCELVVQVPEDQGIHLREVQEQSAQPATYNWIFRASPHEMPEDDAAWLLERLNSVAAESPVVQPVQLAVGADPDEPENVEHTSEAPPDADRVKSQTEAPPERVHSRIQYLLARLAHDMGLQAWIARNDKNATYEGNRLGDLSVAELPFSYDSTTQGTIERIDVLWLNRHRIEAAFEIEHSTTIYSGLLRMSDLLAMQPSIDIPLYIVAPDERRHHVFREIRRPSFARLETPLHEVCRYLPFTALEDALERHGDAIRFMRPNFLDSIAEKVT